MGKSRIVNDFSRPEPYPSVAARQQEARTRLNEIRDSYYGNKPTSIRRQKNAIYDY